jgi:tetratricopeptide (TPR) repeat protein
MAEDADETCGSARGRVDWSSPWWFGALAVLVIVAFAPVHGFGWVFDDGRQIVDNQTIRAWSGLYQGFVDTLWSFDESRPQDPRQTYRPLFVVYLTLARHAFGDDATGYHLGSLLLHLAATAVVWRLALRLRLAPVAALLAAGVFALHPAQIQAVSWVSATTDPMQMIALGLGAIAWVGALEQPAGSRRAWAGALGAAVGLLVGMLCIERAFVFVGVLVAFAGLWPSPATWRARALLFLPVLAAIVVVVVGRSLATGEVAATVPTVTWPESVWTSPELFRQYAELVLLPLQTSMGYPLGIEVGPSGAFATATALGLAVVGLGLWTSRGSARLRTLLVSALIMLAPALVARLLHPQLLVQDRYLYVPMAFFAIWVADVVWSSSRVVKFGCAAWLVLLAVVHRPNLMIWEDNLALYTRAAEVAPGHPTFAMNLSNERRRLGLGDPDCELLRAAVLSMEDDAWRGSPMMQHYNLANCWRDQGEPERAIEHYLLAFEASGETALAPAYNLASLELERGDRAGLERALARLREHFPEHAATWRLHGIAAARAGQPERARELFERALAIDPEDAQARSMLERLPPG